MEARVRQIRCESQDDPRTSETRAAKLRTAGKETSVVVPVGAHHFLLALEELGSLIVRNDPWGFYLLHPDNRAIRFLFEVLPRPWRGHGLRAIRLGHLNRLVLAS